MFCYLSAVCATRSLCSILMRCLCKCCAVTLQLFSDGHVSVFLCLLGLCECYNSMACISQQKESGYFKHAGMKMGLQETVPCAETSKSFHLSQWEFLLAQKLWKNRSQLKTVDAWRCHTLCCVVLHFFAHNNKRLNQLSGLLSLKKGLSGELLQGSTPIMWCV